MITARGRALGKYQLIAEIARGGMGIIYLAMTQGPGGFNKLLVVKELKPEVVEEPAFLMMFLDEARLAARLSHPNIVQTNEVGNDDDRYFLAMEYLDGRGLDQMRRRARAAGVGLSLAMQLRVLCDMLGGLAYAHALTDFDGSPLDIVHRDVSPQNVFVTFDGQVKLLDFGIAKAADSLHETRAGVFKGKVAYMSPEQARGSKVDARADVFSAGVMLWEALTGRRTREGQNEQEKLWALVAADLPRASSVKPAVPAELDEICARAMAWDRDERYQSAGELQADLEHYLAASGTNVTARDVGAWVSELFREDRARTSALIEAHVAHARTGGSRDDVPVIEVTARSGGGGTPSDPRAPAMTPGPRAPDESPTAPSAEVSAAAPSGPRRLEVLRARTPMMIAGAAFAATFAGLVVFAWPSLGDKQEPAARLAVAPPVSPPTAARPLVPPANAPAPPAPPLIASQVSVEIRVSPANATLTIDDAAILGNPFVGNFRSDSAVHHLRASAPGYVSKSLPFELDANLSLDLSLERVALPVRIASPARRAPVPVHEPAPPRTDAPGTASTAGVERPPPREPPPAPTAAQPALAAQQPAPAAATEVDPAGGSQPRRPIDPKDPYSGQGGPP